jgi:hypothetical protein
MLLFVYKSEKINMSSETAPELTETAKAISRFSPEAQAALRIADESIKQFGQTLDPHDLETMRAALRIALKETDPPEATDEISSELGSHAVEHNQ